MSFAGDLRRSLVRSVYPAVGHYYRSSNHCPPSILRFLGIAHPSYRTDFYTLSRIVEEAAGQTVLLAECGIWRGATILGMANRLREVQATGWHVVGFDSFEGFPEPADQDALPDGRHHVRAAKGFYSDTTYEEVNDKVRQLGFKREITLVKGYFENTLSGWADHNFGVVHLDCDLYSSYMTCLNFFYPRMRPGGFIVFDEYDFSASTYPGAQKAIDSFLLDKPEKIQRFPESVNPRHFIVKQ
jgi:Macrocin-O-methyltransferase (TylF)